MIERTPSASRAETRLLKVMNQQSRRVLKAMNQQPRLSKAMNQQLRLLKAMNQRPRVLKAMNQRLRLLKGFFVLSRIPAPPGLSGTFSDHQASPVVISDLIGSPGFAGDHLGFLSHRIGSPGIAGDQLGISDLIVPPGLPLVALGLDLLGLLSISPVCSRSPRAASGSWARSPRFALDLARLFDSPVTFSALLDCLCTARHRRWFSGASDHMTGNSSLLSTYFLVLVLLHLSLLLMALKLPVQGIGSKDEEDDWWGLCQKDGLYYFRPFHTSIPSALRSSVSPYQWHYAVLTATYLLNRNALSCSQRFMFVGRHQGCPSSSTTPPVEFSLPLASLIRLDVCRFHLLPQSTSDLDLPIALRKTFSLSLSSLVVPKSYREALSHPGWRKAMEEEMHALELNHTWDLIPKPAGTSIVGCRWVFTVKQKSRCDKEGIQILINHLSSSFLTKDLGYLGSKPVATPMEPNLKLMPDEGDFVDDPDTYRRLVGKLIYLTITRPDISYAVSIVSQFMTNPRVPHMNAVIRILKYLKNAPGRGLFYRSSGHLRIEGYTDADWAGSPSDRKSTTGYCTFIGGNLVTWRSKKQSVVARSSAEAEYRAMAHTTCELTWLRTVLQEFGLLTQGPTPLYCDNQAAIHIASNPVFHERTKHIEVDCHFVRSKVESKDIITPFVPSGSQLADIFTKALPKNAIDSICSKLGVIDIYSPA
uniref:Reverse transcriptase Ty1/copia-type domain-containing protein n=1 Tax=Fagus sylvatica TaxID=28930 RepID=A0A2N9IU27_FAGSY